MVKQDFEKIKSKINEIISNKEIFELIKQNHDLKFLVEELNTALIELEMQSNELQITQNMLFKERQKYKDLFYSSPVAFLVMDSNGNIVEINKTAKKLLEVSDSKFQHNPFLTYLFTNDLPKFYNYLHEILVSNETIKAEFKLNIKDKETKVIEFNGTRFLDELEQKMFIRAVLYDVTERYGLQKYAEELNQQLESMLMSGNVAWWRMNVKTMTAEYHPAKAKLLGYTVDEFSNDVYKIMSFVHPDDYQSAWNAMKDHLEGKAPFYEATYRIRTKDGKYKWILDRGRITKYDDSGNPELVIGIFTDITQLKEIEEMLMIEKERLQNSNNAKTKLVSVLSHDLRSPYATIINYLELLNERYDIFDDSKKKELIKIVYETARSSLNLLENLLEWAKSDSDSIKIEKRSIQVYGFIMQIIDLLYQSLQYKKINVVINGDKDIKINTDLNLLSAILRNLLSNAIKFSRPNSNIYIDFSPSGDNILFSVRDEGIGMNETQLQNLFNISKTLSRLGTSGERGSGFGLKIVKEYVNKLGGQIWVSSQVDIGTTFSFTLPMY